jgi:signal peptidase I
VTARHARRRGPRVSLLTAALCGAVLVSAAGIFGWDLSGGRLMATTTPSMCPAVCVGSLVAVRPLEGPVRPGELVAFRPPGQRAVFTHRVVAVEADGSFTTKGDAESSPDPWVVAPSDVVGRVAFTLFGLGWWLRALPLLAVGAFCLLVARSVYRWRDRRAFERMFGVAVLVAVLLAERPLFSGQVVAVEADPGHRGWLKGLFVNTGLLPARPVVPGTGPSPVVSPSHLAWVRGLADAGSTIPVHLALALPGWGWAVLALIVVAPLAGFVVYRARRPVEADPTGIGVAQALILAASASASASASAPARAERGPRHVHAERHVARHRRRDNASEATPRHAWSLARPTQAAAGNGTGGADSQIALK